MFQNIIDLTKNLKYKKIQAKNISYTARYVDYVILQRPTVLFASEYTCIIVYPYLSYAPDFDGTWIKFICTHADAEKFMRQCREVHFNDAEV